MLGKRIKRNVKKILDPKMTLILNLISWYRGEKTPIFIDYKPSPTPRYGHGKPPNDFLYHIINANREQYISRLTQLRSCADQLAQIPLESNHGLPAWRNKYLTGLDVVALYGLLSLKNPNRYVEVGSGSSTKFARKAIKDNNLRTKIISIDPEPRSEIDHLCDRVIRKPFEEINLSQLDQLHRGDILYIDSSHRAFTNSDVTVVFLEVLPRLPSGVFVHFHDIFLPYDYPPSFAKQWYSEQYLLACYLLAEGNKVEIILPNMFISKDKELSKVLKPLWERPELQKVYREGGGFWIRLG